MAAIAGSGCSGRGGDTGSTITIAAIGPMTGSSKARGQDLQQAAALAVDEINARGGVGHEKLRLVVIDDGDDPDRAAAVARKAADSSALAVLGGVASSAAYAEGQAYKQLGIPAITGAASESRVTQGNDWYFRLFGDAAAQGRFLGDYARYRFGARRIVVLRETGTSGDEFASALRDRARSEGIRIQKEFAYPPAQMRDAAVLMTMGEKIAKLPKPDAIVLGTQYSETPDVLRALRDKLGPFVSMGYSSLATDGLSAYFKGAEQSRRLAPGYYTEGFTVAAPQLGDVAEYAQTVFASRYRARYGSDPAPEAVRWYEGTWLLAQGMGAKGTTGSDPARDRVKLRDWLASLNSPESAGNGVAGPIFFDKNHDAQRDISVGVFHDGRLISAPVQFIAVADPDEVPGWDALSADGLTLDVGGAKYVKTPVVYAGIELNSLDNIDTRANTFAADFFLWLRYDDNLKIDPHEFEFPSAVSGATLGHETEHRSRGGFTTVTYHVKGVFKGDYEFSRFPFDEQVLRIPVQFHNSNSYTMILADGLSGAQAAKGEAAKDQGPVAANPILASKLWRLKSEIYYRDVVAYRSSFGEESNGASHSALEVNRINAAITIRRDVVGFAIKNFLPLVCILIAVIIGYALASDVINPRVSIGVTALLTTSVLYQKVASDLPTVTYIIAMDYVFFAFFGICATFLLLTVLSYDAHKEKRNKLAKWMNWAGAGFTVVGLATTLIFVWMVYWAHA